MSNLIYLRSFIRRGAVHVDGFTVVNSLTNFSVCFSLLHKIEPFHFSNTYLIMNQELKNDEFNHSIFCLTFGTLQHLFNFIRASFGLGTEITISEKLHKILNNEPYDCYYKEPLWQKKINRA